MRLISNEGSILNFLKNSLAWILSLFDTEKKPFNIKFGKFNIDKK